MTNLPPTTAEERARWKELCESWRSSDEFVGNVARTALPRLLADIERLEAELAETQRAKHGTPCKCESWIDACRLAEERAERLEAVAEAAERYIDALDEMDAASTVASIVRADDCEISARATLRQALAESGKL